MPHALPPTRNTSGYRGLSLWHDTIDDIEPRPSLGTDTEVDVAIVGAGYTGLWTAYHLVTADPTIRVAVIEKEVAGFGASGRNGGWCSALFPASLKRMAAERGRDAAVRMQHLLHETVAEIGRIADAEGIDCHFDQGGYLVRRAQPGASSSGSARRSPTTARGASARRTTGSSTRTR